MLETIFEETAQRGLVYDGVIAQSAGQSADLWKLREMIPRANKMIGAIASHDISLPLSQIPKFIYDMTFEIKKMSNVRVNCFGHLGDGNLHFNIFAPEGQTRRKYSARKSTISQTGNTGHT